jgi:hypothetical protein
MYAARSSHLPPDPPERQRQQRPDLGRWLLVVGGLLTAAALGFLVGQGASRRDRSTAPASSSPLIGLWVVEPTAGVDPGEFVRRGTMEFFPNGECVLTDGRSGTGVRGNWTDEGGILTIRDAVTQKRVRWRTGEDRDTVICEFYGLPDYTLAGADVVLRRWDPTKPPPPRSAERPPPASEPFVIDRAMPATAPSASTATQGPYVPPERNTPRGSPPVETPGGGTQDGDR